LRNLRIEKRKAVVKNKEKEKFNKTKDNCFYSSCLTCPRLSSAPSSPGSAFVAKEEKRYVIDT
tara:strand:- start:459 stop:647 length:189 start_codon:yes stop_codon:yes gene_type:complete